MKRFSLIALSSIICLLLLVACSKVQIISGKAEGFDSFVDLDAATEIIVLGTKKSEEKPNISRTEDGDITLGYTTANFKIDKVMKNEQANAKIKEENTIPIMEHSFSDGTKQISYNGYKNRNEGEQYLLFLSPEQDGLYAIRGVTQGKVPVKEGEVQVYQENDTDDSEKFLSKIFIEARAKYIQGN
ncbi:hypothetical protein ACA30_21980 [Virgibacillus soli]|uniref:Lipoprotein n=1 Tax=Lederbergia galactosidilytica TaxID=217031 RepID=A0A0Q9Y0W8_9BACI|nr:hypothetical protein ACA30_21980 [Virgibacillus soli]KRG10578.1 hypothetical protein ACA29_20480 [Lederbergia galactosidilytica]